MEILMEHSKMRKDASKLRNHDLKMKIVQLDAGFHVVVSKVRKNVSSLRYRDLKINKPPPITKTQVQGFFDLLSKEFSFIIFPKKKLCPAKRSILWNIRKCARMPTFEEIVKKLGQT